MITPVYIIERLHLFPNISLNILRIDDMKLCKNLLYVIYIRTDLYRHTDQKILNYSYKYYNYKLIWEKETFGINSSHLS